MDISKEDIKVLNSERKHSYKEYMKTISGELDKMSFLEITMLAVKLTKPTQQEMYAAVQSLSPEEAEVVASAALCTLMTFLEQKFGRIADKMETEGDVDVEFG
jgi:hypothetical protein